jgi:PKHD-type hydroxylase
MAWLFHTDKVESWAYIDNVFSPEECEKIVRIGLSKNPKESVVIGDNLQGKVDKNIRDNTNAWLNEKDDINWVYQKLTNAVLNINKQFFNFDLYGFCEDLQFTQYSKPKQHYDEHIDKVLYGMSRKLTLVVQLTDPDTYEGCNLELNTGKKEIMKRNQGTVLFFPSYVLHKVTPLESGSRYSLVAWIAGKDFK